MSDAGHMSGGKPIVPSPPEERLYTLEEAKAHIEAMECRVHGHTIALVTTNGIDPIQAWCERCFKSWEMVQK